MKDITGFKSIVAKSHLNSAEKGFWKSFEDVLHKMKIARDVHGDRYFDDEEREAVIEAFMSQKIMLIVSEISEALESLRKQDRADFPKFISSIAGLNPDNEDDVLMFKKQFEGQVKDSFEDEMADTIIRIFDLCGKFGIDIENHILYKQKYNETREKKHGKRF